MNDTENNAKQNKDSDWTQSYTKDRVDSLKTIALLLLHEIESVQKRLVEPALMTDENRSLSDEVESFEIDMIRQALIKSHGHQRRAAKILGTKVTTLNAKIKRYNIDALNFGTFAEKGS